MGNSRAFKESKWAQSLVFNTIQQIKYSALFFLSFFILLSIIFTVHTFNTKGLRSWSHFLGTKFFHEKCRKFSVLSIHDQPLLFPSNSQLFKTTHFPSRLSPKNETGIPKFNFLIPSTHHEAELTLYEYITGRQSLTSYSQSYVFHPSIISNILLLKMLTNLLFELRVFQSTNCWKFLANEK